MRYSVLFFAIILVGCNSPYRDLSYSKPVKTSYNELKNPARTPVSGWAIMSGEVNFSFGDDNLIRWKN